jgi:pyruvate carboxylase
VDLDVEKKVLEKRLGRHATEDELVLYLQHPNDAVNFLKFETKFGKTWVLSPKIWFNRGGFSQGEKFDFPDAFGRLHTIEIGPQRKTKAGDMVTYMVIDHHTEPVLTVLEQEGNEQAKKKMTLSAKEIGELAKKGDIRSHISGTVNEIPVTEGAEVEPGQVLIILEAMKMLNNVASDLKGQVVEIRVSPGDKVEVGDPLMTVRKE